MKAAPKAWTVGGLGSGFGTPSVVAGKIYVMGAVDNKDGVFCLNEADGKELWFTPIGPARMASPNNGPGCQPTVPVRWDTCAGRGCRCRLPKGDRGGVCSGRTLRRARAGQR